MSPSTVATMSSVCKNLPLTSGVFIVFYFLSAVSAQENQEASLSMSTQIEFMSYNYNQLALSKILSGKTKYWGEEGGKK